MSGDKVLKEPTRFVYTSSLFEMKPELTSSQLLTSEYTSSVSQDASQGKIFGNSARFYKALKDYQQHSDPNILKEELWASRKEITNLEKLLLEKTEEILELKKSGPDMPKSDLLRKTLENEKNSRKILEMENLRLKNKLEEINTPDSLSLAKFKSFLDLSIRKFLFESDDRFGRILNKLKENEFRIRKVKTLATAVQDQDRERIENVIKEKMTEILELKKELGRLNRVVEKRTQENDEKIKIYSVKIEELRGKNEKVFKKVNELNTENKLLNEINYELEKENISALKNIDEQKAKIKELRKKLSKSFSFIKKMKNKRVKVTKSHKLQEKYSNLKKKIKDMMKNNENNENLRQEITKLDELGKVKDLKILELQSDLHRKEMIINNMSKEIETAKLNTKGISLEKYEKVLNDFNKLNEDYEKLLRTYSDSQESNEKSLKLEALCTELNEKVIDLEANIVIYSAKIQKYKALLDKNNISVQHSRNPSSDNFSNSEN
jgi:hypothetical protein